MTDERIAEIKALCERKTDGSADIYDRHMEVCQRANAVPELLAEVERLRGELDTRCLIHQKLAEHTSQLTASRDQLARENERLHRECSRIDDDFHRSQRTVAQAIDALQGAAAVSALGSENEMLRAKLATVTAALVEACDIAARLNGDMGDDEAQAEDTARIAALRSLATPSRETSTGLCDKCGDKIACDGTCRHVRELLATPSQTEKP